MYGSLVHLNLELKSGGLGRHIAHCRIDSNGRSKTDNSFKVCHTGQSSFPVAEFRLSVSLEKLDCHRVENEGGLGLIGLADFSPVNYKNDWPYLAYRSDIPLNPSRTMSPTRRGERDDGRNAIFFKGGVF